LVAGAAVDGDIHKKGGGDGGPYEKAHDALRMHYNGNFKEGFASMIDSGENLKKIKIENVIVVAGPKGIPKGVGTYTTTQDTENRLYSCYLNSLLLADKQGAKSIAFPSISTGIFGFPGDRAAAISLRAMQDFISMRPKTQLLNISIYGDVNSYIDASSSTPKPSQPPKSPPAEKTSTKPTKEPKTSSQAAEESTTKPQNIDQLVNNWSLIQGGLDVYEKALEDPAWKNEKALNFLHTELLGIQKEINDFESGVKALEKSNHEKLQSNDVNDSNLQQLKTLLKDTPKVKKRCENLLLHLKPESTKKTRPAGVVGFQNARNTCYINSALQPLLAINNFLDLVPTRITQNVGETAVQFEGRQQVHKSLKTFLDAWKRKATPSELGQLIGKMRMTVFQTGLQQGGLDELSSNVVGFQDAGSIFGLILFVIGQGFQLQHTKLFEGPLGLSVPVEKSEPHTVLNLMLSKEARSVQDKVNACATPTKRVLSYGNEYRYRPPNSSNSILLTKYTESYKLKGNPPELLVLRDQHHQVNLTNDRLINCSILFDKQPEANDANYELVGFSQNHHQVHWTSVVYNEEDKSWNYCDDDIVRPITPNDAVFSNPANYLVYKRKPKEKI